MYLKHYATLLVAISLCLVKMNAQTDQGSWLVGTTFRPSLGTQNADESRIFNINVGLNGGYFITNSIALGTSITFNQYKNDDFKATALGLSPFARYYFTPRAYYWKPFLTTSVNFSTLRENDKGTIERNKFALRNYEVGLGLSFMLSRSVGLEGIIHYSNDRNLFPEDKAGLGFRLGIQVYFGK